jgi:hypothetical protein
MLVVMRPLGVGVALLVVACVPQSPPPAVPTTHISVGVVGRASPSEVEPARRGVGDEVEVEWQGRWYAAVLRELRGDQWLVHYDGYGDEWDEAVGDDRIRPRSASAREEPEPMVEPAEDDQADP